MLPSTSTLENNENLSDKIVALFIIYISNGDLTKFRRRRVTRTKPVSAENSWPILVQNQPFALSAWALWWTFTLLAHFCKWYVLGWKWCDRSDDQSDKGSDDLIMRLMIPVFNSLNVTWLEGIDDRDGEMTTMRENISPILPLVTWLRTIFDQNHHYMLPGWEERGRTGLPATKPGVDRSFLTITTNKGRF